MKDIIVGQDLTKIFRRGSEEIYALRNVDSSGRQALEKRLCSIFLAAWIRRMKAASA
jgi:hypothetical protein